MNSAKRWLASFGLLLTCATAVMGQANPTVFSEGFEGVFPSSAWQADDRNRSTGLAYWGVVNSGFGGITAHAGNGMVYCAGIGYNGTAANPLYRNNMQACLQRTVDLSNYSAASLSFSSYIAGVMSAWDFCRVYAYNTSGHRTKLWEQSPASGDTAWTTQTLSLNNFVGPGQTAVKLMFEFDSNGPWPYEGWFLDDIVLTAQPIPVDLFVANLFVAPSYLKQGASLSALRFGVGLTPQSGAIDGRNVTVNFYLSTTATRQAGSPLIGSVALTLTNQPGQIATTMLSGTQLAGIIIPATFCGNGFLIASLQPASPDVNTNNNTTSTPIYVDDYADTLPGATPITTNTTATGMIEVTGDVDCMRVALKAGHQYAVTATLGTLAGAVIKLYGPDQQTLLSRTNSGATGTSTNFQYFCAVDGTNYLQLSGLSGATGTYSVLVQPQRIDLGLTNLVVSPNYLKQGATSTAVRLGVSLSALSAPISGYAATVNFYLSTNRVINANNLVGSVAITLTNQPGCIVTVNLLSNQVSSLAMHAAMGGTYTVTARLQPPLDDSNTNNDWTTASVLVDDYPDTLANATAISTNTAAAGTIEVVGDVDCMKVALTAGHQYAVMTTLGTLTSAVTTIYGPDRQTVLGTAMAGAGSPATISYLSPSGGTSYIHVDGSGAATGTYAVVVQTQGTDLSLANLQFLPFYLKKGATPTNVLFDVGLSAASAAITGRQATVSFYLSSNATYEASGTNLGSAMVLLTIQPGYTATVGLTPSQLAGFMGVPTNASGPCTVIARLQDVSDDANTSNDWAAAAVLADDYADSFTNASDIDVNTDVPGMIEDRHDVDDFAMTLSGSGAYVVTLEPGTGDDVLTYAVLRLYDSDHITLLYVSTNDVEGLAARITLTNASAKCYLQVAGVGDNTGTYVLRTRALPGVNTNAVADVEAISVALSLAPGDVRGQHPASLTYALRNNSLSNPIVNAFYAVDFYLATTNGVISTNKIGHSEITVSIDLQQTIALAVPASQLDWTTIPADLSDGVYLIAMHVRPIRDPILLAPFDPDDTNNWITGNSITSPWTAPVISGKVTYFDTGDGVANVNVTCASGTTVLATFTTQADGNYYFSVTNGGPCSVTPFYTGNVFSPTNRTYASVTNDMLSQNFVLMPHPVISGKVWDFETGAGLAGVTVIFTGGATNTDENGAYSMTVPYGWIGTVTLSNKPGGTFWQTDHQAYTNVTEDQEFQDYMWVPQPIISGMVRDSYTGAGVAGVTVSFTGSGSCTSTTDPSGGYTLSVPYGATGIVTLANTNTVNGGFSPTSRDYSVAVTDDQLSQDFTWFGPPVISGTVRDFHTGGGVEGVVLSFAGSCSCTSTTDPSGYYSLPVSYDAAGTVMLTDDARGGFFSANDVQYDAVTTNLASQDYIWFAPVTITGLVTKAGTLDGASNVLLLMSPSYGLDINVTTDATGSYTLIVPMGWTGSVTPVLVGNTFSPASREYTDITDNQVAQNYLMQAAIEISGRVTQAGTKGGVAGVTIAFAGVGTANTDSSGNYNIFVPFQWSGTATAAAGSGGFARPSLTYRNLTADKTAQNYIWTPAPVISGYVTQSKSKVGVAGVTITFSNDGGACMTAANGYYSWTVPYNWTGTATPSIDANGSFSPRHKSYSKVKVNKTSQNYTWSGQVGAITPVTSPVYGIRMEPVLVPSAAGARR